MNRAPGTAPAHAGLGSLWSAEPGYAHAVAAVAGGVLAGWAVELVRGGAPLSPPAWPVNGALLAFFAAWLFVLARMPGRLVAWLASVPFALVAMLGVGVLGAVGGVIPQNSADAPAWARAAGLDHIFQGAPFAVALLLLLTNLGLATLRKVRALGTKAWFFSLNHVGLWIALACAMFGAGDMIRARMVVSEGQAEAMVADGAGRHGYLPFGILLQRFLVDHYPAPDGSPAAPRKFLAEVTVLAPGKPADDARIEVNKPLRRAGWTLYITNYELSPDGTTDQCLIEAVRDPWLPGVYAGLFLMLGGAVAMLFRSPFDARA